MHLSLYIQSCIVYMNKCLAPVGLRSRHDLPTLLSTRHRPDGYLLVSICPAIVIIRKCLGSCHKGQSGSI